VNEVYADLCGKFYFISVRFGLVWLASLFPSALVWVPGSGSVFFLCFWVNFRCLFIFDEDVWWRTVVQVGCHLKQKLQFSSFPFPWHHGTPSIPRPFYTLFICPPCPWPFVMHGRVNHSYANAVKILIYVPRNPAETTGMWRKTMGEVILWSFRYSDGHGQCHILVSIKCCLLIGYRLLCLPWPITITPVGEQFISDHD